MICIALEEKKCPEGSEKKVTETGTKGGKKILKAKKGEDDTAGLDAKTETAKKMLTDVVRERLKMTDRIKEEEPAIPEKKRMVELKWIREEEIPSVSQFLYIVRRLQPLKSAVTAAAPPPSTFDASFQMGLCMDGEHCQQMFTVATTVN